MKQQKELIPIATGEYLKQHRLERKLSLATVAQATGLDENILRAIEQDQAGQIALVYRNGYIRSYAHFLQIPHDKIQTLVLPADSEEPVIHNIFSEPPNRNPMEKWLRATSYVLASLLIGTLAWQFTHEAVRLSQNDSQFHLGEKSVAGSSVTAGRGNSTTLSGPVNASIAPLASLKNAAEGMDATGQVAADLSPALIPEGESRLLISVSADSWIEITDATGQELEMDLLRAGSVKDYQGKPPFRILFGHASAVRLLVDGVAVDLSGYTQDDVAQLTWPQKLPTDNSEPGSH